MIRLFVALDIPETLRIRLAGLRGQIPGARWVPPENMHLTLRFIGEVSEADAGDIDLELSRISAPPFEVALSGVGHFGSRGQVRALWAGAERNPEIAGLQAKVELACVRAGRAPEQRRFHPHVTLARCRDTRTARVEGFVADHDAFRAPAFPVSAFVLYSSQLGRGGPVYTPEAHYALAT
jgi:2'-5' RNA ligase